VQSPQNNNPHRRQWCRLLVRAAHLKQVAESCTLAHSAGFQNTRGRRRPSEPLPEDGGLEEPHTQHCTRVSTGLLDSPPATRLARMDSRHALQTRDTSFAFFSNCAGKCTLLVQLRQHSSPHSRQL
jgi:hypothetical protein